MFLINFQSFFSTKKTFSLSKYTASPTTQKYYFITFRILDKPLESPILMIV